MVQVVVDSDATSKALIAKGQLRQRVTIIPLNRVNARTASDRQLAAANKAAGQDAKLALSLVGFDGGVEVRTDDGARRTCNPRAFFAARVNTRANLALEHASRVSSLPFRSRAEVPCLTSTVVQQPDVPMAQNS